MKTTIQFSPRALSVIVLLMFFASLLNAQIKIKERVELTSKAAVSHTNTSNGEMPLTFSLNYPAQVDGPMIGFYASWLNTTISYGSTNCYTRPEYPVNHLFWTVTCNGVIVRCNDSPCPDDAQPGEYSGFGGTFGSFSPGQLSFGYAYTDDNIIIQNNPIYFYIGWDATHSYGGYPDDCGGALGLYQICGLNEDGTWVYCQLPDYTVTLTRLTFCPPIEIFYNGVSSIMYMDAQEIKIGLQDACGKNTQGLGLTPVKYYVAITSGKEWGYLYNQATGQYGDSIVCTASDCDTSFIFMAMNQQPNEDQEVILSVWSDNTSFIPATGTIIVQSTKCMTLSLPKPQILPGESERISLMQNYWDGTLSPYSSYQTFSIKLNTDGKYYGTLHCVATGDTGVALIGLPEPFEFIAAGSIDVDSVVVEIEAVAQVMQSFPTSIGTVTKDTLRVSKPVMVKRTTNSSTIAALPSEVNKKNKEYLIERLQLQLDKKSTNKGDEKLKQKIANTIKDLKSQFVDETVKKSTQKLNSLKNITEVSLNTFGEAGCTGKASVTIKKKHLELRSTSGTVYYGDTVDVFIVPCNNSDSLFSQIGPDQDYTFSVALTGETSRYGKLLFNGQSSDSVESVPSVEGKGVGVKFAVNGIEPDSTVDLTFHLKATYIGTGSTYSIKQPSSTRSNGFISKSMRAGNSSTTLKTGYEPGVVVLENPWNLEGDTPPEILLGETKYYYVRNSNGKITLEETTDPSNTTDKANDAIWGANPVTIVTENITNPGKRLGVYWERGKPIPGGGNLTNDMIRLVGRYWADSVYKVALNITYDSKELKKTIEVKKPTKLINREEVKDLGDFKKGNDYSQTIDVRGHPLDIDALVIEIAGMEGIPPQIIKSHMYQESDKTPNSVTDNPQFNPSYRYEPWTEISFRKRYNEKDKWGRRKNDFLDQPFVVETGSMGLGKTVPDHQGVKPIDYEDNPISLGSYIVREWSKYVTNEEFIKAPADLNEWWKNLKKYYKEVFLKQYTENEATTRASNAALIEIQSVLQTVHTEWAQTRKCASYGFTQLMYETARLKGYNKQYSRDNFNLWDRPEDLNDHIIAMPFYKKVMRTNLKSLFNEGVPESGWSEGFEKTWEKAIQLYNKNFENYGKEVLLNSKKFLPISDKVTS